MKSNPNQDPCLLNFYRERGYDPSPGAVATPQQCPPAPAEDARLDRLNQFWAERGYQMPGAAVTPPPPPQTPPAATLREARHRFLDTSAKKAEWSRMLSLNDRISSPPPLAA